VIDLGFDRLARSLAASRARREAVRASVGGVLAAVATRFGPEVDARKKRKRKKKKKPTPPVPTCLDLRASCASNTECCGADLGVVTCREHLATNVACASQFPGRRCCALDSVVCNPNNGNCDCCDDLVCSLAPDDKFRCQPAEP
jgi:hypothetical protein